MPTKNYVYGALQPVEGLDLIREQFSRIHSYRNKLVELERERRKTADAVVRRLHPGLDGLERAATATGDEANRLADAVKRANQLASAAAGRPRRGATKEMTAAARQAKKLKKQAWDDFKAAKKAAYADPAVTDELAAVDAADLAARKRSRAESGLYWGNYLAVEQSMATARNGAPPAFSPWHGTDRHRVTVQVQRGMTPADLFAGKDARVRAEDQNVLPAGADPESNESARRRYVRLSVRVGSDKRRPVFAVVPVVLHRPLPADCRIQWVTVLCDRVGTREKWSVMVTVRVPDRGHRHPDAAAGGAVAVAFAPRECPDGLEVATWAGDDGGTGRVVLPMADMGRFEEPPTLRSRLDGITGVLTDALGRWAAGEAVVLAEHPFERDQGDPQGTRLGGLAGGLPPEFVAAQFATHKSPEPTPAEAASHLRRWKSWPRLYRLFAYWRANRFPGDADGFALVAAWARRYRHLHDWLAAAADQHHGWRTHLFRTAAAALRRRYRTAYLAAATDGEAAVNRPRLTADGDPWVPPPGNELKRTASVGRLRQILVEAFEIPMLVTVPAGTTAVEVMAAKGAGVPAVKAPRPAKFAKKHKKRADGGPGGGGRDV